jgi:hypothetical protein
MSFAAGIQYVDPRTETASAASGHSNTAPLFLTITLPWALTANTGRVTITASPAVSLPSNGELGCVWKDSDNVELLSHYCSVAPSVFVVPAPSLET